MRLGIFGLWILMLCTAAPVGADPALWVKLKLPGYFAVMRHASAPGTGDPETFRLDDCVTQRNLDDSGRTQARAVGDRARAHGISTAKVFSSQWCRCLETARLLDLGPVTALPALNSFFQRDHERDARISALRAFIGQQSRETVPLIFVTHQVTISALTGHYAASGEIIVLKRDDQGQFTYVGAIAGQ